MIRGKAVIGVTASFHPPTEKGLVPGHAHYFLKADYAEAVIAAGGLAVVLPVVDKDPQVVSDHLSLVDGLLLSGGMQRLPGNLRRSRRLPSLRELNPVRYESDLLYLGKALELDLPVLGICRGMQMLNEAAGGLNYTRIPGGARLNHSRQDLPGSHLAHLVKIEPSTILARISGANLVGVNSFHAQAVAEVASGYRVSARAEDGIIEAVESVHHRFVLGTQFHPEEMLGTELASRLFGAFVAACSGSWDASREYVATWLSAETGTIQAS